MILRSNIIKYNNIGGNNMFGLLGKIGGKIVEGVLDVAIAGIDTLDKTTDALIDTTDKMLDKIEDVRSTVENAVIETEYHAREFKNSVQGIMEFSKTDYGRKTYLKDEIDYMKYNANEYRKSMTQKSIQLTDDITKLIKEFNTMKEKINFVACFFNISEEEAISLINEYGLR
jgi:Mg2+ and Co2+ transporter CorA